ncbi:MAG: STAS domain-containing protein [Candidatus Acidiferrales bacterium]
MSKDNLQITSSTGNREGVRILRLKGSLNIQTVFTLQDALKKETSPALILDFTDVPFIDSAGLGALVAVHISSQKVMRKLAFAGMNAQVEALIDMTHVSQLFKTYTTVKDAEASLA